MQKTRRVLLPALILLALALGYAGLVRALTQRDAAFPENLSLADRAVIFRSAGETVTRRTVSRRSEVRSLAESVIAGLGGAAEEAVPGVDGGIVLGAEFYRGERLLGTFVCLYSAARWPAAGDRVNVRQGEARQPFFWHVWTGGDLFSNLWDDVQ